MITVTPEAAKRLKNMLNKSQPNNVEAGIRLAVKSGGCSGFEYLKPKVDAKPIAHDLIFESNGVRIFVDPKTHNIFLNGTEIEYTSNLLENEFVFNNPNAKSSCGCGTSFELK